MPFNPESAKFCALRALVPYVLSCPACLVPYVPYVLSCLTYLVPNVLSCLTCLVPMCSRASRALCPTCFRVLRAACLTCSCVSHTSCPTCSRAVHALVPHVPCALRAFCLTCLVSNVLSCVTYLRCSCTSCVFCLACIGAGSNSTFSFALRPSLALGVSKCMHLMSSSFHASCLLCFCCFSRLNFQQPGLRLIIVIDSSKDTLNINDINTLYPLRIASYVKNEFQNLQTGFESNRRGLGYV